MSRLQVDRVSLHVKASKSPEDSVIINYYYGLTESAIIKDFARKHKSVCMYWNS